MRPAESFVEQPVRSLQTMLRVLAENDRRLPTVIPDGIYGPTTMQAVAAFQRQKALPATGITDQRTWDLVAQDYDIALTLIDSAQPIEIILDPGQVFRQGDSSPYIYLLQAILAQLSNDHPSIESPSHNGVMDAPTARALAAFQVLADLPETGELDRLTWKHLALHFTLNAHHNTVMRDYRQENF